MKRYVILGLAVVLGLGSTSAIAPAQIGGPHMAGMGPAGVANAARPPMAISVPPINAAPVPEYWLADASIFLGNAAETASIMAREGAVNVEAPAFIGNQARYAVASAQRALIDLQALLNNAYRTNPSAVPSIRMAIAELVAALAQTHVVLDASMRGLMGPIFETSVSAAVAHLTAANRELPRIAEAYRIPAFSAQLAAAAVLAAPPEILPGMRGAGEFASAGLAGDEFGWGDPAVSGNIAGAQYGDPDYLGTTGRSYKTSRAARASSASPYSSGFSPGSGVASGTGLLPATATSRSVMGLAGFSVLFAALGLRTIIRKHA